MNLSGSEIAAAGLEWDRWHPAVNFGLRINAGSACYWGKLHLSLLGPVCGLAIPLLWSGAGCSRSAADFSVCVLRWGLSLFTVEASVRCDDAVKGE